MNKNHKNCMIILLIILCFSCRKNVNGNEIINEIETSSTVDMVYVVSFYVNDTVFVASFDGVNLLSEPDIAFVNHSFH